VFEGLTEGIQSTPAKKLGYATGGKKKGCGESDSPVSRTVQGLGLGPGGNGNCLFWKGKEIVVPA
jgi:hypothetical protein